MINFDFDPFWYSLTNSAICALVFTWYFEFPIFAVFVVFFTLVVLHILTQMAIRAMAFLIDAINISKTNADMQSRAAKIHNL